MRASRGRGHRCRHPAGRGAEALRALLPRVDLVGRTGYRSGPVDHQVDRGGPQGQDLGGEHPWRRHDLPGRPAATGAAGDSRGGHERSRGERMSVSGPTDGQPVILAADDDPDILELVTFRLERSGYTVLQAMDGEQAVA